MTKRRFHRNDEGREAERQKIEAKKINYLKDNKETNL